MCVRNCVRTGLSPSFPPHKQIYALVCTLPPSIDTYVIKVWSRMKNHKLYPADKRLDVLLSGFYDIFAADVSFYQRI